jgi:hypothetical protein
MCIFLYILYIYKMGAYISSLFSSNTLVTEIDSAIDELKIEIDKNSLNEKNFIEIIYDAILKKYKPSKKSDYDKIIADLNKFSEKIIEITEKKYEHNEEKSTLIFEKIMEIGEKIKLVEKDKIAAANNTAAVTINNKSGNNNNAYARNAAARNAAAASKNGEPENINNPTDTTRNAAAVRKANNNANAGRNNAPENINNPAATIRNAASVSKANNNANAGRNNAPENINNPAATIRNAASVRKANNNANAGRNNAPENINNPVDTTRKSNNNVAILAINSSVTSASNPTAKLEGNSIKNNAASKKAAISEEKNSAQQNASNSLTFTPLSQIDETLYPEIIKTLKELQQKMEIVTESNLKTRKDKYYKNIKNIKNKKKPKPRIELRLPLLQNIGGTNFNRLIKSFLIIQKLRGKLENTGNNSTSQDQILKRLVGKYIYLLPKDMSFETNKNGLEQKKSFINEESTKILQELKEEIRNQKDSESREKYYKDIGFLFDTYIEDYQKLTFPYLNNSNKESVENEE